MNTLSKTERLYNEYTKSMTTSSSDTLSNSAFFVSTIMAIFIVVVGIVFVLG